MTRFLAGALTLSASLAVLRGFLRGLLARRRAAAARRHPGNGLAPLPSLTVIVPAWQERDTLTHCLATLARQDYGDFPIVIVAGGTDGTFEVAASASVQDPRITVISQGPHGKNSALNIGLRYATGDVVVLLDADSMIRPDYLRKLVGSLSADVAAATGNYVPGRRSLLTQISEMSKIAENEVRNRVMLNGSGGIAIRRDVLVRLGEFPEGPFADDWDLTARLAAAGHRVAFSPDALVVSHRPATLCEWWSNELRWRRIHLRSVFRVRDVLFTGPVATARHLYPYIVAWSSLLLGAGALAANAPALRALRTPVSTLCALIVAHWLNRDLMTHVEGIAYSGQTEALLAVPLIPLTTGLGWWAAALASLSPGEAPVQAKGPRQVSPPPVDGVGQAVTAAAQGLSHPQAGALGSAITVAIVNYNTRDQLAACLASAVAAGLHVPVLVLDNASTDGSADLVRRDFPWVELHVLPVNRGFAAGANAAVRLCRTPYVLLLNSDTQLAPGSAEALASYLDAHPNVAVAGPRLLNPDGSLQYSCHPTPTPFNELLRWTFLGALAARVPVSRKHYLARWSHSYARPVGWLVGAALAIRRSAFETTGGFDESFFMYSEEVDLMHRLRKAGWDIHFAPVTNVVHVGGASTVQQRAAMVAQLFISMHRFYARHYSGLSLLQLKLTLSYFMLRNLGRDWLRLRLAAESSRRGQIQEDVAAWRRVLSMVWD